MMPVVISLAALLLLAVMFVFSVTARNAALTLIEACWHLAIRLYEKFKRLILILALPGLIFFLIFSVIGVATGSPVAGIIMGVMAPIWILFFILKRIPVVGVIGKAGFWATTVLLIVATPAFLLGVWSPSVKRSFDGWMDSKKSSWSFSLDQQAEYEKFALVTEDAVLYESATGKNLQNLRKGDMVLIIDRKFRKVNGGSEPLIYVMTKDKNGEFLHGNKGFVLARKLGDVVSQTHSTGQVIAREKRGEIFGTYRICWDEKCGRFGTYGNGNFLRFVSQYKSGESFVMEARETGLNQYEGNWEFRSQNNPACGSFSLKFSPDGRTAEGIMHNYSTRRVRQLRAERE